MILLFGFLQQYKIGQLYMIARHSLEQSGNSSGVEIVQNEPCEDPIHGKTLLFTLRILPRCGFRR
jgi:hypothetical protein